MSMCFGETAVSDLTLLPQKRCKCSRLTGYEALKLRPWLSVLVRLMAYSLTGLLSFRRSLRLSALRAQKMIYDFIREATMSRILLLTGGEPKEIPVGQELTIGRAYSNLLRLDGDEISRVHSIVYRRGNDHMLRDLDSKNGTLLNGRTITTAVIHPGDEIRIGNYVMLFDPTGNADALERPRERAQQPDATFAGSAAQADDNDTMESIILSAEMRAGALKTAGRCGEQVFFTPEEVEAMCRTGHEPASVRLAEDTLRMHRELARLGARGEIRREREICQHFLLAALAGIEAARGAILFKEEHGDAPRLGAIAPEDKEVAVNHVTLRAVLRESKAVLCNDAMNDARFAKSGSVTRGHVASLIAHPIMRGGRPIGLIYADVPGRTNAFRREHLLILQFLARLLALCLPHD
ncbi:MAG: FHA domain-containing protein [bacterium]